MSTVFYHSAKRIKLKSAFLGNERNLKFSPSPRAHPFPKPRRLYHVFVRQASFIGSKLEDDPIQEDDAVSEMGESLPQEHKKSVEKSALYVVSTPIGNLEDITLRALRVLEQVDAIAAEDTRHTLKLLRHYKIGHKPLISLHEHNWRGRLPSIISRLEMGESVALVSDAGTPAICDPGGELVGGCLSAGFRVFPVPGPCAAVATLSVCGIPLKSFTFLGFLPSKGKDRTLAIHQLTCEPRPVVIYEAPHRVTATLRDLSTALAQPDVEVIVAREITKIYEEFYRGTLQEAAAEFDSRPSIRGEFTIILNLTPDTAAKVVAASGRGRGDAQVVDVDDLEGELVRMKGLGLSQSDAVKDLLERPGVVVGKRELYALALRLYGKK